MIEEALGLYLSDELLYHVLFLQLLLWEDFYCANELTLLLHRQNNPPVGSISQLPQDFEPFYAHFVARSQWNMPIVDPPRRSQKRRRFFCTRIIRVFALFVIFGLYLPIFLMKWWCICFLFKRVLLHTELVVLLEPSPNFFYFLLRQVFHLVPIDHRKPRLLLIFLTEIFKPQVSATSPPFLFGKVGVNTLLFLNILRQLAFESDVIFRPFPLLCCLRRQLQQGLVLELKTARGCILWIEFWEHCVVGVEQFRPVLLLGFSLMYGLYFGNAAGILLGRF